MPLAECADDLEGQPPIRRAPTGAAHLQGVYPALLPARCASEVDGGTKLPVVRVSFSDMASLWLASSHPGRRLLGEIETKAS